jgi:hypothetical protein
VAWEWHWHGPVHALLWPLIIAWIVLWVWIFRRLFGLAVELAILPQVRRLAGGRMPLEPAREEGR